MRYFYFLVFIGIVGISAAGLNHFGQQFFGIHEIALDSKLQANLSALRLTKAEFLDRIQKEKKITLLFVGDIMLSRGVANQIKKHNDYKYPFLKIAEFLRSVDLTFGNLEGPISSRGENQGSIYSFRANPLVVQGLRFAGFDVLSLANNHIWDWGREALEDTIFLLEANGIEAVGVGRNYQEANKPLIINFGKSDYQTKIAFLAYSNLYPKSLEANGDKPGISQFDLKSVKESIQAIRQQTDIIVVSFHWGEEYQSRSNSKQQAIAHSLIEAGADLIVGHHPHVIQEIEYYQNSWIAYSLGNFVFDQNFSEETKEGLILRMEIQDKNIISVEPIKVKIYNTAQPEIIEL